MSFLFCTIFSYPTYATEPPPLEQRKINSGVEYMAKTKQQAMKFLNPTRKIFPETEQARKTWVAIVDSYSKTAITIREFLEHLGYQEEDWPKLMEGVNEETKSRLWGWILMCCAYEDDSDTVLKLKQNIVCYLGGMNTLNIIRDIFEEIEHQALDPFFKAREEEELFDLVNGLTAHIIKKNKTQQQAGLEQAQTAVFNAYFQREGNFELFQKVSLKCGVNEGLHYYAPYLFDKNLTPELAALFCEIYGRALIFEDAFGQKQHLVDGEKPIWMSYDQMRFLIREKNDSRDPLANARSRKDISRIQELLGQNLSADSAPDLFKELLKNKVRNIEQILACIDLCKERKIEFPYNLFRELAPLKNENPFCYLEVLINAPKSQFEDLRWWFGIIRTFLNRSHADQGFLWQSFVTLLKNSDKVDLLQPIKVNLLPTTKFTLLQEEFDQLMVFLLKNKWIIFLKHIISSWKTKEISFTKKGLGDAFFEILKDQNNEILQDPRMNFFLDSVVDHGVIAPERWLSNLLERILNWQDLQPKANHLFCYEKIQAFYADSLENALIRQDKLQVTDLLTLYHCFTTQRYGLKWENDFFHKFKDRQEIRALFIECVAKRVQKLDTNSWKNAFKIALSKDEDSFSVLACIPYKEVLAGFLFECFLTQDFNSFYQLMALSKKEQFQSQYKHIFAMAATKAKEYISGINNTITPEEKIICNKMIDEAQIKFRPFLEKIEGKFEDCKEYVLRAMNEKYAQTPDLFLTPKEAYVFIKQHCKSWKPDNHESRAALRIIAENEEMYFREWYLDFGMRNNIEPISRFGQYQIHLNNALKDTPHTGSCWLYGMLTERNNELSEAEIRKTAQTTILSALENPNVQSSLTEGLAQTALFTQNKQDSQARKEARISMRVFIENLEKDNPLKALSPTVCCEQILALIQSQNLSKKTLEVYAQTRFGESNLWGDSGDLRALAHAMKVNLEIISRNGFEYNTNILTEGYPHTKRLFFSDNHYQRIVGSFLSS